MDFIVGLWSVTTAVPSFTSATINQRINDLESAVDELAVQVAMASFPVDQKIRGIFVAPEYFLAHQDAEKVVSSQVTERTISVGERDACVQQLCALSTLHPHILIVPGTIAWKKTFARRSGDPKTVDRRQRGVKQIDYFINLDKKSRIKGMDAYDDVRSNGATYYLPSAPVKRQMILGKKSTKETVDGNTYRTNAGIKYYIRNTAYAFLDGEVVYKYHKRGDFFESVNTDDAVFIPSVKRPVVSLPVTPTKYMTFGFEICLDHHIGMLKRLIAEQNISNPDFHIISSASVENDIDNMCMRDGGYMLHASSKSSCTCVFKKNGSSKTRISMDSHSTSGGYTLRFWALAIATGASALFGDVDGALKAYNKTKTFFASAASKNAYDKLLDLHSKRDEAGLRSHLDWYLGKPGARQPQGAGSQIPKDKRFFNLLNAFKY